jgi:PelA/Pel-15E family pectate lyase
MLLRTLFSALTCLTLSALGQSPDKPKLSLEVEADLLALHLKGTAPVGTTALEYRMAETGSSEKLAWTSAGAPAADGSFRVDVPLPNSVWQELQVRAMQAEKELVKKETHPDADTFSMLTPERLSALPEAERAAWTAYMKRSEERRATDFSIYAAECRKLNQAVGKPAPGNSAELEMDNDTPESWYAGPEAKALADAAISYQTPAGGWSKAVDYSTGPRAPGIHWTSQKGDLWHYCGTFDNRTTTEQIKLLAAVHAATQRQDAKDAAQRGLEYLLEAQFPNGGWPQNYPIESGYHEAITLNDDTLTHNLELLLAVAEGKEDFAFTQPELRQRAQAAFAKALSCLKAMQIQVDGKPTVWCAQHDPLSLAATSARTKEPPSLSGAESAQLVKFLMRSAPLTAEVTALIEPALAWLESHQLKGMRKTKNDKGKTDYVADAASTEVYWARFYDLKTGAAIFPGADDGILYATYREMAAKNKVSYDFMTTKPRDVISKEVARWKKRQEKR